MLTQVIEDARVRCATYWPQTVGETLNIHKLWVPDDGDTGVNPAGDTSLQYFGWGDVNGNIPTNIITYVRI